MASITSTSWCASAQSSPTNSTVLRPRARSPAASGRTISDLMNQCSRHHKTAGTTSHSDQLSRPTGRGTIFHQDSTSRETQCSPAGGYQTRVCRTADSLTLIRSGTEHAGDVRPGLYPAAAQPREVGSRPSSGRGAAVATSRRIGCRTCQEIRQGEHVVAVIVNSSKGGYRQIKCALTCI
jgi:hypothetical protein